MQKTDISKNKPRVRPIARGNDGKWNWWEPKKKAYHSHSPPRMQMAFPDMGALPLRATKTKQKPSKAKQKGVGVMSKWGHSWVKVITGPVKHAVYDFIPFFKLDEYFFP